MKQKIWFVWVVCIASIALASTGAWSAATGKTAIEPAVSQGNTGKTPAPKPDAIPKRVDFDHLRTGFPLTGAHAQLQCETCHAGGRFAGTPKRCAECHSPGSRIATTSKPASHMQTNEPCEQCHRSAIIWSGARFSHATVAMGTCNTCHDGHHATGKPANHVVTTASCDTCHRTMAWVPALAGGTLPANHRPIPAGSACTACHAGGSFAFTHPATTTGCATCHDGSTATGKPGTVFHTQVNNSNTCEACHKSTSAFTVVTFSHSGVTPGQCSNCHTGANPPADGKPNGHVQTSASCDSCHGTSAWIPATSLGTTLPPNHRPVPAGTACSTCHVGNSTAFTHPNTATGCTTCHNGSTATGKPGTVFHTQVNNSNTCEACHKSTSAFTVVTFSHTGVTPGQCSNCHNGANPPAVGKSANHIQTTASCDSCHTTVAWIPANFSHTNVAPGSCASCHNGSQATGKPNGHFVTTQSCDKCHRTTAWTPVTAYTHTSPYYRPHNSGVTCTDCHTGNSEVATWTSTAYKPDCAGCHASRFKPDSHKKVDSPKILYTVAELKNCAGSCHEYTDSTFTTIKKTRSGQHRSTDGGF